MKGSAIVQSLKSLAAKFHPQLPLSQRESQRLLTALTTSFRKQLDEAHPRHDQKVSSDSPGKVGDGTGSIARSLHSSSAALADKHLASVLTNPLLAQAQNPKQLLSNHDRVLAEIQADRTRDPIAILEKYHSKGAATIQIANSCLREALNRLGQIPEEKQRQAGLAEAKLGKRVLYWLWNSEQYQTDEFCDATGFQDLLMSALDKEGSEEFFWGWYSLETPLGEPTTRYESKFRNSLHSYRWKGRLLRALIGAKLENQSSAAAALDAFSRAAKIRADGLRGGADVASYPLHAALIHLCREIKQSWIRKSRGYPSRDFDAIRFERFQNELGDYVANDQIAYNMLARNWLYHPTQPSPDLMLGVWKKIFNNPTHHRSLPAVSPRDQEQANSEFDRLVQTASLLLFLKRPEEADWVISKINKHSPPRLTQHLDKDLAKLQGAYRRMTAAQPRERPPKQPISPRRIPFPSFRLSPT